MAHQTSLALFFFLAQCGRLWLTTGSLACTGVYAGLYLLAALTLRHPRFRTASRWLPIAEQVLLTLALSWFGLPWTWADAVDALARPSRPVRVVPQLAAARVIEPELVACPTCLGTGRDPKAPAAIADDDGTCPGCCDPRHLRYAAHHGLVRPG